MAKPIPSPSQIAAIESELLNLETQRDAMILAASLQTPIIAQKLLIDSAFEDLFDWYNDDVIGKYDAERKSINGSFVISPIVEADIIAVSANPPAGRLVPYPPVTDIVRIAEFDGGAYSGSTPLNELQHIADQAEVEDILQNGVPGGAPVLPPTVVTDTVVTASSTTVTITDTVMYSVSIGDVLVIADSGDAAVVQITSVTPVGSPPPYEFNLGITVIIPPVGTLAIGASVYGGFTGFTDGERAAKTASNPDLQGVMDGLIDSLEADINARKARIAEQLLVLAANDDPDGVADIATASSNASASDAFLTSYLVLTDISDAGLASLSAERISRTSYLNTRVSQIIAAYTGQTENYYDQRYIIANSRGNTYRGTLRAYANAQEVQSFCLSSAASIQDNIDVLEGILP